MKISICSLALLVSLLVSGCRTVEPPSPPLGGAGTSLYNTNLWREVARFAPKSHGMMDARYYCPDETELRRLFPRMFHLWQEEIWDCDDIAQEALVVARRLHRRDGTAALCAGLIAYRPGTNTVGHAAIIVRTSAGVWKIYDPAPDQWSPLPPPEKIFWISI